MPFTKKNATTRTSKPAPKQNPEPKPKPKSKTFDKKHPDRLYNESGTESWEPGRKG